jgi:hypothetical protein
MPDEPREAEDVEATLLARAEQAIESARQLCEESEVMLGASHTLREGGLATRCAWCGRYRIEDRWLVVERVPAFAERAGVSHGICDDCIAALKGAGLSV